ncbi:sigma-70 family RNA polymerase sigma factor [Tautonia sp. JC769]|uniref:sigma-70 family RNA polymerase sigma factor n=1 Tax=Tautonia sp. JC769 TaxID=3232135 RepID=UPI003457BFEE
MAKRMDGGILQDFRTLFRVGVIGHLTDGELLERFCSASDEAAGLAFEALVRRHGPMVLRTCRAVLGHEHDARDAFQASFLVLVRKANRLRGADTIGPWLYQVAHRTARSARAQRARRLRHEHQAAARAAPPIASPADPTDTEALILDELNRLPARDRAVLSLCGLAGRTNEQAARELGLPVGTVQSRLHRARSRLRARLLRRGIAAPATLAALLPAEAATAAVVPLSLVESTSLAALRYATHGSIASAASAPVAGLARTTLKAMLMTQLKVSTTAVLTLGLLLAGGATVARSLADRPDEPPEIRQAAQAPASEIEPERDPTQAYLEGVVIDDRETPVPGAVVSTLGSSSPRWVRTDDDGRFLLPLETPTIGHRTLRATARGGDLQGILRLESPSRYEPETTVRIVVRPSRTVTVRVVGPDGAPESGATVELFENLTSLDLGETDASGVARFLVPADATIRQAFALKAGVGFDYAANPYRSDENQETTVDPLPDTIALSLNAPTTARVEVVDSDGRGLPGVEVVPGSVQTPGKATSINLYGSRAARTASDASGFATFDWLPAELEGSTAIGFGLGSESHHTNARPRFIPSVDGNLAVPKARMLRPGRLSGAVTHADGSPAVGVLVQADGSGEQDARSRVTARTDADGRFSMTATPDQLYIVSLLDDRFAVESRVGVLVREGDQIDDLDFRLIDGTILRGRVTGGPDDAPQAGKTLVLTQWEYGNSNVMAAIHEFRRWAETDADGRYSFRVGPGKYKLIGLFNSRRFELEIEDQEVIENDFSINPPDPVVPLLGSVRIGSPDGEPLADAAVLIEEIPVSGRSDTPIEADADGRFATDRRRRPALLFARDEFGLRSGLLLLGPDDDQAVIVVGPSATATGRVLDRDGAPMAGVRLQCSIIYESDDLPDDHRDAHPQLCVTYVETDADGVYTVTGLVPGHTAWVTLNDPKLPFDAFYLDNTSRSVTVDGLGPFDLGDITYAPPEP